MNWALLSLEYDFMNHSNLNHQIAEFFVFIIIRVCKLFVSELSFLSPNRNFFLRRTSLCGSIPLKSIAHSSHNK